MVLEAVFTRGISPGDNGGAVHPVSGEPPLPPPRAPKSCTVAEQMLARRHLPPLGRGAFVALRGRAT